MGLLNEFASPDAAAQLNEEAEMCNKYRFSRKEAKEYEYWKVRGKKIKSNEDASDDSDNDSDEDHGFNFLKPFSFYGSKHRYIRQTQPNVGSGSGGVVGIQANCFSRLRRSLRHTLQFVVHTEGSGHRWKRIRQSLFEVLGLAPIAR